MKFAVSRARLLLYKSLYITGSNTKVYIVVISRATPQDLSSSVSCTHTRKGEGVESLSRVFYILTTVFVLRSHEA